jgi:hypothetical protein
LVPWRARVGGDDPRAAAVVIHVVADAAALAAQCVPTGELPSAPTTQPLSAECGLLMPKPLRTRLQERDRRIEAERNQPPPF